MGESEEKRGRDGEEGETVGKARGRDVRRSREEPSGSNGASSVWDDSGDMDTLDNSARAGLSPRSRAVQDRDAAWPRRCMSLAVLKNVPDCTPKEGKMFGGRSVYRKFTYNVPLTCK